MITEVYRITQSSKQTKMLQSCICEKGYHRELYFLRHFAKLGFNSDVIFFDSGSSLLEKIIN